MPDIDAQTREWILSKYKLAFPHAKQFVECTMAERQKQGIDYYVLLQNGDYVFIEEKIRWEKYPDILIEEYANWEKKTPGWGLDTTKKTQYLAYIIVPAQEIFMFYFPALQRFFIANHDSLLTKYGRKFGKTYDYLGLLSYTTSNIPTPWNEFDKVWLATNVWTYDC